MSRVFTTFKQSERLIKAGIDKSTSDAYNVKIYKQRLENGKLIQIGDKPIEGFTLVKIVNSSLDRVEYFPSWSVERLITLLPARIEGDYYCYIRRGFGTTWVVEFNRHLVPVKYFRGKTLLNAVVSALCWSLLNNKV